MTKSRTYHAKSRATHKPRSANHAQNRDFKITQITESTFPQVSKSRTKSRTSKHKVTNHPLYRGGGSDFVDVCAPPQERKTPLNTPTPDGPCDSCDAVVRWVTPDPAFPRYVEIQVLHDDDCRWLAGAEGRN